MSNIEQQREKLRKHWGDQIEHDKAVAKAAADRQAQLEKDALRYRFLRGEKDVTVENGIPWCVRLIREHGIPTSVEVHGDMLDVVVDVAIAAKEKEANRD